MVKKVKDKYKREIVAFILVFIFLLSYSVINFSNLQEEKVINKQYWYDYVTEEVKQDVWYIQPIIPLERKINDITLALYQLEADTVGKIEVRLKDSKGNVLSDNFVQLAELVENSSDKESITVTFGALEEMLSVQTNEIYYLEIRMTEVGGTCPSTRLIHDISEETIGNLKFLQFDGETTEKFWYIASQKYSYTINYLPILLGMLLVFGVVLFCPVNKIGRMLYGFVVTLAPVWSYVCFEWVSGYVADIEYIYSFYNIIMLYLIWGIGIAVLRIRISTILLLLGSNLLSLANYFVQAFRGTSIKITDLWAIGTAAKVAENYEYRIPVIFICSFMILIIVGTMLFKGNFWLDTKKYKTCQVVGVRLCMALMCIGIFVKTYSQLPDTGYNAWSTEENYKKYGWLYTNCIQLQTLQLKPPDNFDTDKVLTLLSQATADNIVESDKIRPHNLIVIMNESFADLSVLGALNTNRDEMSFIRSLEDVQKGYVSVHAFGGGTCNTEWEFLTGNNFQMIETEAWPYPMFYSKGKSIYSTDGITKTAHGVGYHTVAMHPNGAANWNRNIVYPCMEFEEFLTIADYEGYETLRDYVSDLGDYKKIIDYHEEYSEEPLFIFNITMQNHGGYMNNEGLEETVSLVDFECREANTYLSLIYQSDLAFEELLSYFSQVDETTMIVMFGDHQPQLADEFYDYVYGKTQRTEEERELQFITPYIIWTNYEREYEDIPVMSIHYLGSYIKQEAGLELTDYEQYQLEFMQKYPVIGKYGIADSAHNYTTYSELTAEQNALLEEFKAVQYYHMKEQ